MHEEISLRRRFIGMLLTLGTMLPAGVLLAAAPVDRKQQRVSIHSLRPFLNTLLPGDSTPSATQLGVDKALVERMRVNRNFARLVALGCAWLDKQAEEFSAHEFASLDETERETVISRAERAPANSLPRQFFERTQKHAFDYYYAQPAAWKGLGYAGPPQPMGFPDHAMPPRTDS